MGSAFAISSFGAGGWDIKKGMNATYELTQYIVSTYKVAKVYLVGLSMGGAIALMLAEKYPNVYSGVMDISGSKNITERYNRMKDWATTTNDTELAAKIQSVGGKVPPFPFNLLAAPPLSNQLNVLRNMSNTYVADFEAETGGTPDAVPQAYQAIDPLYYADISIPVISIHGTADALTPYSSALQYQDAVAAAGKSSLFRLYTVDGGEHADLAVQTEASKHMVELSSLSAQFRPLLRATAFTNVTVLSGWTWWFFTQSLGGTGSYTYQWYEGNTSLQGQTSMVLSVTKTTRGVYEYYCQVTDSEGIAINTNIIALTVI
jgi:pimeloyl-ACP methyl ester carboxylesterase